MGRHRETILRIGRIAAAGVIFGAVPALLRRPAGPRWFWTVTIAALPMFIVLVGYYSWRELCPLSQTAQLASRLRLGGKRRAGKWLETRYALVQLTVLFLCLCARHLGTNGDGMVLGGFLLALFLTALVAGLVYRGKSWCNFFCPVGVVERIYTEPAPIVAQPNSQCTTCTACKKFCPDIDLEQSHWHDATLASKALATYAFPGLVFGFYFYYWAKTGAWESYFGGGWTRDPGSWRHLAEAGFFFLPQVPRYAAAPITLFACAAASALVFWSIERIATRHRTTALAAFVAFNVFYLFAGAPTLGRWPLAYRGVQFLVVLLSTTFVVKSWRRSEQDYVQEKFARGFLARWKGETAPPSLDPKELYVIHTERQKQKTERLQAYKETLRDLLLGGVVTIEQVQLLARFGGRLGVSEAEHEKMLAELARENPALFDPSRLHTAEKQLQQDGYRKAVERLVLAGTRRDPALLEELRREYQLSHEEAEAALADLEGPLAARIQAELAEIEALQRHLAGLGQDEGESRSLTFLRFLVGARVDERIDRVLSLLASLGKEREVAIVRELYASREVEVRGRAIDAVAACGKPEWTRRLAQSMAERIGGASTAGGTGIEALLALAGDASPFLRACAVFVLARHDDPRALEAVRSAMRAESALVRETAVHVLAASRRLNSELVQQALADPDPAVQRAVVGSGRAGLAHPTFDPRAPVATLTTLEQMMLLHKVGLFERLSPDDLLAITRLAEERHFAAGELLCHEGDVGHELFLLVAGRVRVEIDRPQGPQVLGEQEAGSCVGEIAVLDRTRRTADVVALTEVRTLAIAGDGFRALLLERPDIARQVMSELTERLRGMIARTYGT